MEQTATVSSSSTTGNFDDPIKSIAFFDIETTGLPDFELNKTKITEICFVGCTKEQIFDTKKSELPRVLHKLSLCINPFKAISQGSTDISGLDNYMLEYDNKFNENVANTIINFLKHLQHPVCIVSHNGDKFDFPILMKEFKRLNMELPSSIKCLDSLPIFRNIDNFKVTENSNLLSKIEVKVDKNCSPSTSSTLNGNDEINVDDGDVQIALESSSKIDWQKLNETTPHRQKITTNESAPSSSARKRPAAQKELFANVAVKSKPKRFTLIDIYAREFGSPPQKSHYAESDTLALLKCVIAMKTDFFKYIDGHARNFCDVKPL